MHPHERGPVPGSLGLRSGAVGRGAGEGVAAVSVRVREGVAAVFGDGVGECGGGVDGGEGGGV